VSSEKVRDLDHLQRLINVATAAVPGNVLNKVRLNWVTCLQALSTNMATK
jgi:hypothetical protein